MGEKSSETLQEKCKSRLQTLIPEVTVRTSGDALLFNVAVLTASHINYLSYVDGMYKDINVKRSGKGVVVILSF
jgi:hypothetical protein